MFRAIRCNLFFVPQKSISAAIPAMRSGKSFFSFYCAIDCVCLASSKGWCRHQPLEENVKQIYHQLAIYRIFYSRKFKRKKIEQMAIAKIFRNYAAFIITGMTGELRIKDLNFEFILWSVVYRPSSLPHKYLTGFLLALKT